MTVPSPVYGRLFVYPRPHVPMLLLGTALAVVVAAMEGAIAGLVKPAMDDVFIRRDEAMLKIIPLLFLGAYVCKAVGRYGYSYLMAAAGERVIAAIRRDLYIYIGRMSLSFSRSRHSAELASRIVTDVNRLARLSSTVMVMTIRNVVMVVVLAAVMFVREWRLALIALVVFPFIGLAVRTIGRKLYRINRRAQRKVAELNVLLYEVLSGTKIVKAFGREAHEVERFDHVNRGLLPLGLKDPRTDQLGFRHVDSDDLTLHNVSLTIDRGEVVAFVGMSGAGKSTLMDLLPRFHDVSAGRITIDGHDLRNITQASLRALIGLVTQETFLFSDSILYNIAYGRPGAPFEDVVRAARQAHAEEFIVACPDGYQTLVGERGVRLSGGQRQRIAIARAFLKNPPILILDEATSDLDAESEFMIQQALAELMRGRTVLVIAHRLATVRNADRIVVVHEGRIAEVGRHDELLARDGLYRRLYALQMEGVST